MKVYHNYVVILISHNEKINLKITGKLSLVFLVLKVVEVSVYTTGSKNTSMVFHSTGPPCYFMGVPFVLQWRLSK